MRTDLIIDAKCFSIAVDGVVQLRYPLGLGALAALRDDLSSR
jgi:hypothetical protein